MKTKQSKRRPSGHTANCTKKSLYFENSQLAEINHLIARLSEHGATVTFTSVVRRALAAYLAKQNTEINEANQLFS